MFLTIFTGVMVFVLGQFVLELIINPIKKYKELKERIAYTLAMYCCLYTNPYRFDDGINVRDQKEYDLASEEVRKIGSELAGFLGNIPKLMKKTRKNLNEVKSCLIGISNGFYQYPNDCPIRDNRENEKRIKKILKID